MVIRTDDISKFPSPRQYCTIGLHPEHLCSTTTSTTHNSQEVNLVLFEGVCVCVCVCVCVRAYTRSHVSLPPFATTCTTSSRRMTVCLYVSLSLKLSLPLRRLSLSPSKSKSISKTASISISISIFRSIHLHQWRRVEVPPYHQRNIP